MERARRPSMLQLAILVVVALFGCALITLSPGGRRDEAADLAARVRLELPDLTVVRSGGILHSEDIYLSAGRSADGAGGRPVARLRPRSRGTVRVAMYDPSRRDFGHETVMDMDTAISRIGLGSTGF